MAILNDYNQLIREHFDISDTATRKCIVALEDAEQTQLLAALSSALYDKIVQKVDKIDFGSIPNSRGDITKVEGFENTLECLQIMRKLVMEYKENTDIVDNVLTAIDNIRNRKAIFMKAYALNIELPMVMYNLIVLAIEQSVSFLIATCIQYIKDPASQDINSALDKVAYNNTRDNLLYEQLADFNKSCLTKEFDDTLQNVIKNGKLSESMAEIDDTGAGVNSIIINVGKAIGTPSNKDFKGSLFGDDKECDKSKVDDGCPNCKSDPCCCDTSGKEDTVAVNGSGELSLPSDSVNEVAPAIIAAGIAAAPVVLSLGLKFIRFTLKSLIPMIRNITYYMINSRVKLSDSLAIQAQFIEANVNKLQYSTTSNLSDDQKKKVIEKQKKWAERLKKWSNTIAIDSKKAEKDTKKMVDDDKKQKTIEDLKDQLPPDIADKGGLFAY